MREPSTAIVIVAKGHHEIPKDFLLPPFITVVAIAVKEMTPLRPRAIEVSAPIWTREQNQLLRSSTDGALLQVIYSQKTIFSDTGYLFLENIGRWR